MNFLVLLGQSQFATSDGGIIQFFESGSSGEGPHFTGSIRSETVAKSSLDIGRRSA
jgi:hypothetical protein